MNKAITSLLFVYAFALCARAAAASGFTTGTSFEKQALGNFDPYNDDFGKPTTTGYYWETEATAGAATVRTNLTGGAYGYTNTVRNAYLVAREGEQNVRYLELDLDKPLERYVMPAPQHTNVFLYTTAYDGIYADTLVKLTPSLAPPDVDATDKVVVWLRESEADGQTVTNLIVTAGRYAGGYDKIETAHYVIASPQVTAETWHQLTIRAISDMTNPARASKDAIREMAPGMTVYIDGMPAVADASYDIGIGTVSRADWLTPEARVLIAERRIFPWIARAGENKAMALQKLSFAGCGALDDVLFTTSRPGHVVSDNVFTLKWDAGVTRIDCTVSNATGEASYSIDATELPRYRDYALGTNHYAQVTVTDVAFDEAHDYSNGVWTAKNDCTVAGRVFTYDGASENPIGIVSSSRNVIGVGEGGCETFAEAKARAKALGMNKIVLMTNVVVAQTAYGAEYRDAGHLTVSSGEDFVLDLNGHTLRGQDGDATITQSGGRLRIIDSSAEQTGRVIPSALDRENTAVKSKPYRGKSTELVIEAGWYDGLVEIAGTEVGGKLVMPTCVVDGGGYTNFYGDAQHFYLEQYVTNAASYFALDANDYWTMLATNAFIWCGEGADDLWHNPDNWRGKQVPGAGDTAIFPRIVDGSEGWDVDFGEGAATKRLWMDADILMAGTNDFTEVQVVSGDGSFGGTNGVMCFVKKLPGRLADGGANGVRLLPTWAGTVRISKVTSPKVLTDIASWGTARSKVEFNGVRGYLNDSRNYAMPYGLILTDDGTTAAWKNDTGFDGSSVTFPSLAGTGTFDSAKNLKAIRQIFKFRDVRDFSGKFKIGGKRLLLGEDDIPEGLSAVAKAGFVIFSDAVCVQSQRGWEGVNAYFLGSSLNVLGQTNDVLMTLTDKKSKPDLSAVAVALEGETNEYSLVQAGTAIVVTNAVCEARRSLDVGGLSVLADSIGASVKSGGTFDVPDGSAVSIVGNDVIVNGRIVSSFPSYYTVAAVPGTPTTYAVQFDEDEAKPSLAAFTISGDEPKLQVENAQPGLWYGVQTVSSLAEDWDAAPVSSWVRAYGDTVTLEPGSAGSAGFYRVLVTDREPNGGDQ